MNREFLKGLEGLTDEAIDMLIEQNDEWTTEEDVRNNYENILYYAYSFYDSPAFLRYDSTLDVDEVGNQYTGYTPSSYSEGIVYLYYMDETSEPGNTLCTMFVDYSYTDVTVSPDSTDDSSLVIAIALIIAVIGLIVQKIVRKAHIRKARATAAASPNASRRRYPMKKAAEAPAEEKKAEPAKPEEKPDDGNPYDD